MVWSDTWAPEVYGSKPAGDRDILREFSKAKQKLEHAYILYTAQGCILLSHMSIQISVLHCKFQLQVPPVLTACSALFSPLLWRAMYSLWAPRFLLRWVLSLSQSWRLSWEKKSRSSWNRCRRRSQRTGRFCRCEHPALSLCFIATEKQKDLPGFSFMRQLQKN